MNAAQVQRQARQAAECYSKPSQFSNPEEFLEALTEALDELCGACDVEPPVLEGVWSL